MDDSQRMELNNSQYNNTAEQNAKSIRKSRQQTPSNRRSVLAIEGWTQSGIIARLLSLESKRQKAKNEVV